VVLIPVAQLNLDRRIGETKRIFGLDCFVGHKWFGFALFVDGLHSKQVLVAFFEALRWNVCDVSRGFAKRHPFLGGHVHLFDDVFLDGLATVILRSSPVELAGVCSDTVDLEGTHWGTWTAEENHFNKLFVLSMVVCGHHLVLLGVLPLAVLNSELGVEIGMLNLDVSFSLHLVAKKRPHRCWHWLTLNIHINQDGLANLRMLDVQILSVYSWTKFLVFDCVYG